MKHALLAGTFEIGERIRNAQIEAVKKAHQLGGDICILVNDIGIAEKLLAYEAHAINGVNDLYARRLACARSGCQITQLPKTREEVDEYRDDAALKRMLTTLRAYTSSLEKSVVQKICTEVIVPAEAKCRIELYGSSESSVHILYERELRNSASQHLRASRKHSPQSFVPLIEYAQKHRQGLALLLEELQSQHRIPTCRAIMLELYTTLSRAGYEQLTIVQEDIHQLAFEHASELYCNMHNVFVDDQRFSMQIVHVNL
ncbi:MAG: hypothetical protein KIH62_002710 [Candidatus Kerfeldbacteria bacterium]|nr:hypothetical protein [Candidatus Kerfeldbacteria bacterium]